MKNHIVDFLEIQGYKVGLVRKKEDGELVIKIKKKKSFQDKCPECQSKHYSCHAAGRWRLKKHGHF